MGVMIGSFASVIIILVGILVVAGLSVLQKN